MRRRAIFVFAMLSSLMAMAGSTTIDAQAQESYPNRPITLITPYAAGGGSDYLTRVLAEGLHQYLHEVVLVQNVGGAGGAIGSMQAARAKPDGYTLLLNHIGMATIPLLYKKLNFDPLASYEFIGLFAEAPMVILARKEFGPKSFAELVAYAKANKGKLTMASSGMGSATHLCALLFQEALGIPITMAQYKGAGPALIDVRSGQVDLLCDLPTTTSSLIRNGDVRAYVLTATRRMASLPDVPTATEVGMPSLSVGAWYGFYAPLGTPRPVIEILNKALRATMQDPAVAQQLEKIETYLLPLDQATPEAHRAKLASQIELWRPIIEKAGVQAE
ncbi:MAG: tripartite tricarboxylate transporter substrate binding protein BugD [Alphaproteobacteria bacterium]|nr:tripartite tricarboxylate transporter substrate binding protein BugD [Alphaproteobacteria bacterium]